MRVKLNRGPMKGKRYDIQDGQHQVIVAAPADSWGNMMNPMSEIDLVTRKVGVYQKSYQKLADGTVIFEWMGWRE